MRPSWRDLSRRLTRRPLLVILWLVPFVAVFAAGRAAIAPLATRLALPVELAADRLGALPTAREPTPLPPTPEAEAIAELDGSPNEAPPAPLASGSVRLAPGPVKPPPAIGILVGRKRVQAAVKAGIRPSGTPVPATPWRPAGLALAGVSALGVGLRDGDVLVRAGGTPARSDGAVIGAVRGALESKARAISGEVWRGKRRIVVTVELPKVKFKRKGQRSKPPRDAKRAWDEEERDRPKTSPGAKQARQPEPIGGAASRPGAAG